MAGELGAFPGYAKNARRTCCASSATIAAPPMARTTGYEGLSVLPVPLDHDELPRHSAWSRPPSAPGTTPWSSASSTAIRNAQATVIAPTGTIGLVMDCDTTGIEPDFALVKFKKLAGGGYFKIINRMRARCAARRSATADARSTRWCAMPWATRTLKDAPGINHQTPARPRASPTTRSTQIEKAAGSRLRHPLRVQQVDAGRGVLPASAGLHRRAAGRARPSTC